VPKLFFPRYTVKVLVWTLSLAFQVCVAQDPGLEGHSDTRYHLDKVVVESSALQDTLFNSAQSVSVLSGINLDEKSRSSLGDTLALEPGMTSSSFGPGAGRPVIRGIGGDRIRILENSVGTLDISNVSPDHPVTVESSLVDRVEVVRGPASLMYGTSAVGGIVNVFDKRISEKRLDKPVSGTVEVRGESVDLSRAGVFSLDAPAGPMVFHADGFSRRSDDVSIPGFARTERLQQSSPVDYPEPRGTLPWSWTDSSNLTLGSSYIFKKGYAGLAVSDYQTSYAVPNGEPDVSVDASRKRLDFRTGIRDAGDIIESATARLGAVDYGHTEFDAGETGTKFKQNAFDGRIDLTHREISSVRGTWGAQLQGSNFEAIGLEAFQPPTDARTYSIFGIEEALLSDTLTMQFGGRYDWNTLSTSGFQSGSADDSARSFDTFSQSTGLVWDFAPDYSAALSVAHTERAPTGQELYADGRHVATGAYEIGDADLGIEQSLGTDLTLRKKEGVFRGFVGGFYNRFRDYISLNPTGTHIDGLPVYLFEPVGADFLGFESQAAIFAIDRPGEELSFDVQPDYVSARDRDTGDPLPRIPPLRILSGMNYYNRDLLRCRLEAQHVFAQRQTADFETATDGYTMVNLYLSKEVVSLGKNVELFMRGSNLLSEKARNHVSFIKDSAPLPGASVMAGFRVRF
jgi:iron complex outermembrane receptor protein